MSKTPERYLRFPLVRRIEHWINAVAFIVLAVTGLPQKYASVPISEAMIRGMGGIEAIRIIHRVSAVVLALVAVWHIGYALYHWFVKRGPLTMMLGKQDAVNAWQALKFNFGRSKERPQQGFYTFEEKIEYFALLWGTLVMVVTGFFLWNPITAARFLPGEWIPAAKAAHGGEALLAFLSIILWHLYHVIVKTYNKSMYTGYMSRKEMEHEHPLAMDEPPPPKLEPVSLARRKRQFWIGYGIVATVWLVGVFWFVTTEETATATIPEPESVEVYAPVAPTPFSVEVNFREDADRLGTTWENGIGEIFIDRCGECHDATGEKNLNLAEYDSTLRGGDSGPAVVPGAPGISISLLWPTFDDHPGELSQLEYAAIWNWIESGAPEE